MRTLVILKASAGIAALLATELAAQTPPSSGAPDVPPSASAAARPNAAPPTPEPGTTDESSSGVGDIIVTAQKRSENLQKAPLAITAFDTAALQARQITNPNQLGALAPSITTAVPIGSPVGVGVFIRGIGGQEPLLTLDNAVAIYVDGIVLGRSAGASFDVAELERVEVLRGPQGTLYGRNAVGGAVNFITKKPSNTFGVSQTLTVGNYGLIQGLTTVNTGEIGASGLKGTLSYFHKQRNGVVNAIGIDASHDPGAVNADAFRAALAYDTGGPIKVNYSFDYSRRRSNQLAAQLTVVSPTLANLFAGSVTSGGNPLLVSRDRLDDLYLDHEGDFIDKNWSHTLAIDIDLGPNTLFRSLSGYRRWTERHGFVDYDGTGGLIGRSATGGVRPFDFFSAADDIRQHQWSQEFNLIGNIGSKFDYILGAYYFDETSRQTNPQTFIFPSAAGGRQLNSTLAYRHDSLSTALFSQASYALTDRLKVIGGVRYTWDERKLDQTSPLTRSLARNFRKFNWSATVDFQATPSLLVFAKASTGYKSGGFNARSVDTGFAPENVDAYELGFKSDFLDRRVRLNASIFYNRQKDLQVQQFRAGSGGAQSITTNAGKADFKGIEAELSVVPVDGLTLYANGSYIDRNYKQFLVRLPNNAIVDIADRAKFNYTASTTAAAGAEYKFDPFTFGQLALRADFNYQSKRFFNVSEIGTPNFRDIAGNARGLLDLRAELSDIKVGGGKLAVALFGKNVTDKKYRVSGIDYGSLGFAVDSYGDPMTWGLDARIVF